MTGEITLRGRVLPIGGLKEKLLAALRGGIKTVLIPEENAKDLAEIPETVKNGAGDHSGRADGRGDRGRALVRQPKPIVWEEDTSRPPKADAEENPGPDRALRSRPETHRNGALAGAVFIGAPRRR